MRYDNLEIITDDGKRVAFKVEIPEGHDEYYAGLSTKEEIPENFAMIYEYIYPETASMFTPDTPFFVDFIFCDQVGNILKIHNNAKPFSKELINCSQVAAVLELKGGECERLGIRVGNIVDYSKFPVSNAEIFTNFNREDGIYSRKFNEFWFNTGEEQYFYSNKTHRWIKVLKEDEHLFIEHDKTFDKLSEEVILDKDLANEQAILADKEMIEDYRETNRMYYWADDTLFFEYTPETNCMNWYEYGQGWHEIDRTYNFNADYNKLKYNSIKLCSKEVFNMINGLERGKTEAELEFINSKNKEFSDNLFGLDKLKLLESNDDSGYFFGKHCEGFGNKWEAMFGDSEKFLENMRECLQNSFVLLKSSIKNEEYSILAYPDEQKNSEILILFLVHISEKENECVSIYPFFKGIENDLILKESYSWNVSAEGEMAAIKVYEDDDRILNFHNTLFVKDINTFEIDKTQKVSLSGLAYDIEKLKEQEFTIDTGAFYDIRLKEFLEENPNKTEADFEAPIIRVDGNHFRTFMATANCCVYECVGKITDISYTEILDEKFTVMTVNCGHEDNYDELFVKVYATKHTLLDYVPEIGDAISSIIWLNGYFN